MVAKRKDGSLFPVGVSFSRWKEGDEVFFTAIIRDITELRAVEDELRKYMEHLGDIVEERTTSLIEAERLVTIGQVATMVGHDLRNPLQVIVNVLYLARQELEAPECDALEPRRRQRLEALLKTAQEQIDYMNKIILDLLDYGRSLAPNFVSANLNQILADLFKMVHVPDNIKVLVDVGEHFPRLTVDPFMMKRVFMNLISNAVQAMPGGGWITIRARVDLDNAVIDVSRYRYGNT
ncbi:MAG: PAS domain-containing sensor histidine kinase [Nitrososphaeria archaeon]